MLHIKRGLPHDMSLVERHVLLSRECKPAIGPVSGVGEYREEERVCCGGGYSARCFMNLSLRGGKMKQYTAQKGLPPARGFVLAHTRTTHISVAATHELVSTLNTDPCK